MELRVEKNSNNASQIYEYDDTFSIGSSTVNISVSNVRNNYRDNYEQMLIEDRKVYDSQRNYPSLSGVEFGSNEWDAWKSEHTKIFFPYLNAPVKVRQVFREAKDSIPKGDKEARMNFENECTMLLFYARHTEESGLPKNFELNTIRNYEILLDFSIQRNNYFAKLFPNSKSSYIKSIEFAQDIKSRL